VKKLVEKFAQLQIL
jgi:hypothetical protein